MVETTIEIGKPIPFQYSDRYYDFTRGFAVKDIFDALVELITNSDDSYGHLYKQKLISKNGGRILIEVNYKRKGQLSQIIVRDRAEGMTLKTMVNKLPGIGYRQSEGGDRGFMARGAKDCTSLGDLTFISVVRDKLYKGKLISNKHELIPLENGAWVNENIREELHINKGNGTVVILDVKPNIKIPLIDTISRDLSWHYALRDILSENSETEIFIRKYGGRSKPVRIIYNPPEGKLVHQEEYEIPSYPNQKAKLKIWKASVLLEDPSDVKRFRKSGIIIKSTRAIHECSLLHPGFEKDDYAHHYFGRIDCPFIDTLLDEYDKRRENGIDHPLNNPTMVIDPNRQYGLDRKHPFTESLLEIPAKRLQALIEESRKTEKESKEIANNKTKTKLNELAKAASRFLKQQMEELEISADEQVDETAFAQKGVLIYPTYANIVLNQTRVFSFYVNRKLYDQEGAKVALTSDNSAVKFIDNEFLLEKHKSKTNLLRGSFRVQGVSLAQGVCIQAHCGELPKAEALFNVINEQNENRDFKFPLEFEHSHYKIKEKSKKVIKLYAKFPEVVNKETEISLTSSNPQDLIVRGRCILQPVFRSNFAYAEIVVEARRLISSSVNLTASINGIEAVAKIKIVQKEDEIGPDIKIEIVDKDFVNNRARWADREGKPNLLEISSKHPAVSCYLGPPPYDGQNSPEFEVLEAEIVAESVCMRLLKIETQRSSWLFNWADLKEDEMIADSVLLEYTRRMKIFLPIAHSIIIKH